MPETHTFEVYQWSGSGYNAVYDTSHTATFTDDDGQYEGGGDADEMVSIDGGAASTTSSQPYTIEVSFTDPEGDSHVETFNFFYAPSAGGWYFAPKEGSQFTEGSTLGNYQSHSSGWDYDEVACFTRGTLIETTSGPRLVETLAPGAMLRCWGGQEVRLEAVMTRHVPDFHLRHAPQLHPVKIAKGALGMGLPHANLLVSRQHRMLLRSRIARRMFGVDEVLIAAIRLIDLPGISLATDLPEVHYYHLLCERHAVLLANGAPSESLLLADRSLDILRVDDIAVAAGLIGATTHAHPSAIAARLIPPRGRQKHLIARHISNDQPLLRLCRPAVARHQPVRVAKTG